MTRNSLEQIARLAVTMVGLALFAFCFYQLIYVTRVVSSNGEGEVAVVEAPLEAVEKVDRRPVILVDAGHGGGDGGAVASGLIEKNLALEIAARLVKVLERDGRFRVEMTRRDDTFVELEHRAKLANDLGVALMVSVHLNSLARDKPDFEQVNGVETWFAWPKPLSVALAEKSKFGLPSEHPFVDERGELLAQRVQAAVCEATGAHSRGVKNKGHAVTRLVGAPSIIVECGFLTNPQEAARLSEAGYQERTAHGIATGVFGYLEEAMADPMFGIQQPIKPEKERILTQSASAGS